jgi:hypothetical protein
MELAKITDGQVKKKETDTHRERMIRRMGE